MSKKENAKDNLRHVKKCLAYFFPVAWRTYPGYFVVSVIRLIADIAYPFVNILVLPLIIDELLGGRDVELLIRYTAIIAIAGPLLAFISFLMTMFQDKYDVKLNSYFTELLGRRIMEMDFQLTEDKNCLEQMEKANTGMPGYSGGVHGIASKFFEIIKCIATILGVVALIIMRAPILLAVTVVIILFNAYVYHKQSELEIKLYQNISSVNRKFHYLGFELSNFAYGKDIRLYDARDMMLNKWQGYTDYLTGEYKRHSESGFYWTRRSVYASVIKDIITYLYLGILVIGHRISIGAFSQMLSAGGSFHSNTQSMIYAVQEIIKRCNYAYEYVAFMDYPAAIEKGTRPVREGEHEIEFRHVSFTYPGTTVNVLEDVNITLKPGEHLSIVGLNGAGKTTFVKLLCRLYDPTSGEILLDGVNIKEYDYEQYMSLFTPVFQDFKLFAFTMKENITLGKECDDTEVLTELERVGLGQKIATMESGIHTMLFKSFDENGIEPSGGEQQKLAIARALHKKAPVVILDEPTAALDPVAEYDIYRQFNSLVGGKTAIYISHRLSSCRFCDRIAVFSGGRIAEYGTHDELVRLGNGVYAEMFAAQARYYQ